MVSSWGIPPVGLMLELRRSSGDDIFFLSFREYNRLGGVGLK